MTLMLGLQIKLTPASWNFLPTQTFSFTLLNKVPQMQKFFHAMLEKFKIGHQEPTTAILQIATTGRKVLTKFIFKS